MNGRRCILIGGGPIDGFHWIEDQALCWQCDEFTPPKLWIQEELDPAKPLDITRHQYNRSGRHLFVHESEYTPEHAYV